MQPVSGMAVKDKGKRCRIREHDGRDLFASCGWAAKVCDMRAANFQTKSCAQTTEPKLPLRHR